MGLGLAIIRRLAALLHHEVAFDSVSGRGSRFSVMVPRAMPDDAANPLRPRSRHRADFRRSTYRGDR
jgi:hypothetical protein